MKQSFGEKLMCAANLQSETLPGVPLIEMYGSSRVFVENHGGISLYTSEEIGVNTKIGTILIRGKNLKISCISDQHLVISGQIFQIFREETSND